MRAISRTKSTTPCNPIVHCGPIPARICSWGGTRCGMCGCDGIGGFLPKWEAKIGHLQLWCTQPDPSPPKSRQVRTDSTSPDPRENFQVLTSPPRATTGPDIRARPRGTIWHITDFTQTICGHTERTCGQCAAAGMSSPDPAASMGMPTVQFRVELVEIGRVKVASGRLTWANYVRTHPHGPR